PGRVRGAVGLEALARAKMLCGQRRLITRGLARIPALIGVILLGDSAVGQMLLPSRVVLSLQLPFAPWPLIRFTSDPQLMGPFVNSRLVKTAAWGLFGLISPANLTLLRLWIS
ncbi:divalent metal cation transporter, partial [Pseudomonas syringae]